MAFFTSPATKLERALRMLIISQGKGTPENTYISNESVSRVLPNRTIVVRTFSPTRPNRPEGVCQVEIQHHFSAVAQAGTLTTQQRVDLDAFLGDTMDTLNLSGANGGTDNSPLADAITAAGRWLATVDPTDTTGQNAAQVAANADMANFRCDWVKFSAPMITRGNDADSTNWVEIVHISAFVSHANN